MLTSHELEIVLAHNRIKLAEWLPRRLARSVTIQAILLNLRPEEQEKIKQQHPTTFIGFMDAVQHLRR